MGREEDYGMRSEGEVVQIETLDERMENRRYAGKEKDSYTAKTEANTFQVGRNNSKKDDFIGYMTHAMAVSGYHNLCIFRIFTHGLCFSSKFPSYGR